MYFKTSVKALQLDFSLLSTFNISMPEFEDQHRYKYQESMPKVSVKCEI